MNSFELTYIDKLHQQLESRIEAAQLELHKAFATLLWMRAVEDDLAVRSVSDDAGATIEALRRLNERTAQNIDFHLINPERGRQGWHSNHTIVIVVAPNMPFMVDSVLMALSHGGLVTHHLNNVVVAVDRDERGEITHISGELDHTNRELVIYAEIDRLAEESFPSLQGAFEKMAAELSSAVTDFSLMKGQVEKIVGELRDNPPPLSPEEIAEAIAFLEWLQANHFTFLGYRQFEYESDVIRQVGDAFGVQRIRPPASERLLSEQTQRTHAFLLAPALLSFSKSGTRSRIHRPAYPDYVGVKRFNAAGEVIGEYGFLGLYTSRAYQEFPDRIPVLRHKVTRVFQRSGLDPTGFDGKVLQQVLATYPRDELFQIDEDELFENAMIVTDIHERRRVRVIARYDAYGLFVTTLVYMPRDLFSTSIRLALNDLLVETFGAEDSDYDILLSESILVRVQFTLRIRPGHQVDVDRIKLETRISQLIGDWVSDLHEALTERFGINEGRRLQAEYAQAFSAGYREQFEAAAAVDDIAMVELLTPDNSLATRLYRLPEDPKHCVRLKIFHFGAALPLSEVVPKLENLSLTVISEHPHSVRRAIQATVSIQDYELSFAGEFDLQQAGVEFEEAFKRVWLGDAEDDSFNRLVLSAGLNWRQVRVLRAYAQYMKQIRFGFSQYFISEALNNHKQITQNLVRYFELRFRLDDPARDSSSVPGATELREAIVQSFDQVEVLNEDRILRRFIELIDASKRTNYYVVDEHGAHRAYLSIKLSPAEITNMPRPVPNFEVFVSAPYFEGLHLRGGSIARGGLRWSDRLEDFRTEVLGLVKAQVVKNAVIVPTGAKGGFVVKGNKEGVACYRDFIRGLLDVTDNIVDGEIVSPNGVKPLDPSDPYLVVAADKGTATFSDVANDVAAEYQFWLGDAFASGGSFGYDHKKMGITARGAWVSVQRHFAERDIDVQSDPVTVLGIGDMAGDVFGNGMLLSQSILLVAAFNHQHIFVDPNPDPEKSYVERQRLFALPRSSWSDFDASAISEGGGIFPRSAKSINITPAMQARFDISETQLAPDELINRLLRSPVQLIWNGGIGTYVKASHETHADAGDRANDHLRVDANQLRCAVIGEGGNLGLTQAARVEYCVNGGAMNTDFIDNSAGVDCSDHEVNIKIVLNDLVAREDITRKQRNKLLEAMTDEVAELVLSNNYRQAQSISIAQRFQHRHASEYQRLLSFLSQHAGLDRALEFLPSDDVLAERQSAGLGLTRPELAVLLAYAKTHIKTQLIDSDVHLDDHIANRLVTSFPKALITQFGQDLSRHRLAREIIATQMANEIVDSMGISFVAGMSEAVGSSVSEVVRAYALVAECYKFDLWFEAIASTSSLSEAQKLLMRAEIVELGERATRWVLRNCDIRVPIETLVGEFAPVLSALEVDAESQSVTDPSRLAVMQNLRSAAMPSALAQGVEDPAALAQLLPLIDMARLNNCRVDELITLNNEVGEHLNFEWLAQRLHEFQPSSHWQALQIDSLLYDLFRYQCLFSAMLLKSGDGEISNWQAQHAELLTGWNAALEEIRAVAKPDLALYALSIKRLEDICTKLDIGPRAPSRREM